MRQGPHKTSIKTVNIDIEEMNARIKEHRRNIFLRWLLIIAITAGCVFIVGLIIHMRTYTSYKITKQIQRNDVSDAGFLQMDGNILKYSADGASYINLSGETIWSQSYEMQQPQADAAVVEIYRLLRRGLRGLCQMRRPDRACQPHYTYLRQGRADNRGCVLFRRFL